jgi:uncharacterized integral membrane protein (TIGR00698 family)
MKRENIIGLALPGIIIAFLLSFLAEKLSHYHPMLDALFIAFIGGIIIGNIIGKKTFLMMGAALCKDILIPIGLLLYGTQINWLEMAKIKSPIFLISLVNTFLYFIIIFLCNRYLFSISNNKLSYLNGGANSICGVSATAVFIPFVNAKEDEVTATLLAVVITGLISVFSTWFIIQRAINLPLEKYAALCGVTLNQTGAVKAAASLMSKEAAKIATTVKFFRTSLIIPVALLLMFLTQRGRTTDKITKELRKSVIAYGIFIALLFFGASLLFTFTPLKSYSPAIKPWFTILFGMTLVSVGFLCDLKAVLKKEVIYNTISSIIGWIVVVISSILLIKTSL